MTIDSGSTRIDRSALKPEVPTYSYAVPISDLPSSGLSLSVTSIPIDDANASPIAALATQPALRPGQRGQPSMISTVPSSGNSSTSQPKSVGLIRAVPRPRRRRSSAAAGTSPR